MLVGAATLALRGAGLAPIRVPGRGRSNIWDVEESGQHKRVSIRTTKNRRFAFPPLETGTKWRTLDDVDIVVVAAVDDYDDPRNVEVYRFDAEDVRKRFDASYAARIDAGHKVRDDFGMWLRLDEDDRGLPAGVGAGLATAHLPIATFPIERLIAESEVKMPKGDMSRFTQTAAGIRVVSVPPIDNAEPPTSPEHGNAAGTGVVAALEPRTIGEVLDRARKHIATLSGVRMEAVKLDCRIET